MNYKYFLVLIGFFVLIFIRKITPQNFYFGDLHVHTTISDGAGNIDSMYFYAKNIAKLDFMAITDHDINISNMEWEIIKESANFFNASDFVTFIGYEWTSYNNGDRIVLYSNDNPKIFYTSPLGLQTLFDSVKNQGGIINIAHPDCFTILNMNLRDTSIQKNIEITGYEKYRFEYFGNPMAAPNQIPNKSVQNWLLFNEPIGFLGSSDEHGKFPGKKGLTGVYAKSLTRVDIFEALKSRSTFATTGPKIKMLLRAGNSVMGGKVILSSNSIDKIPITLSLKGEYLISKVEVIVSNSIKNIIDIYDFAYENSFLIEPPEGNFNIYVRAFLNDGHMAWTSPIFFQRKNQVAINDQINDTKENNNCKIYPNPSFQVSKLYINGDNISQVTINIINSIGQVIKTFDENVGGIGPHEINLNFENMASGFYLVRINYLNRNIFKKLLIVK